MRISLLTTLGATLTLVVACANLHAVPIGGGERCYRCERTLANRFVAGEAIGEKGYVAYKFRTVRCMLTYLKGTGQPFEQVLVVDYHSGKLVPVQQAHFVRVAIDRLSDERGYGIGDFDYVAFRSQRTAETFASSNATTPMDWATVRATEALEAFTAHHAD